MAAIAIYKSLDLPANTPTILYTVSDGKQFSFTYKFTNRTDGSQPVRLAYARADIPLPGEWNEYGAPLPPNGGVLLESGIVMPEKIRIVGYALNAGVSLNAWGYEE